MTAAAAFSLTDTAPEEAPKSPQELQLEGEVSRLKTLLGSIHALAITLQDQLPDTQEVPREIPAGGFTLLAGMARASPRK